MSLAGAPAFPSFTQHCTGGTVRAGVPSLSLLWAGPAVCLQCATGARGASPGVGRPCDVVLQSHRVRVGSAPYPIPNSHPSRYTSVCCQQPWDRSCCPVSPPAAVLPLGTVLLAGHASCSWLSTPLTASEAWRVLLCEGPEGVPGVWVPVCPVSGLPFSRRGVLCLLEASPSLEHGSTLLPPLPAGWLGSAAAGGPSFSSVRMRTCPAQCF